MGRKPGKAFRNMERIGAFRNLETRGLSHSASTRIKRATRSERAHPATTPGTTLDLPHRRPFPPKPAHPVDHVDLWGWIDKCRGRADPRLRYSDVELRVRCIDPVIGEVSEISSAASSATLDRPVIEYTPRSRFAPPVLRVLRELTRMFMDARSHPRIGPRRGKHSDLPDVQNSSE